MQVEASLAVYLAHGHAGAVDGDEALVEDVVHPLLGDTDADVADVALVVHLGDLPGPDHVTGDVVSSDLVAHLGAALDSDPLANLQGVQRGQVERLLDGVEAHPVAGTRDHRLADALDRHARSWPESLGELLAELDLVGKQVGLPIRPRDFEGSPHDA